MAWGKIRIAKRWLTGWKRYRIHARSRRQHSNDYVLIDEIVARYRVNGGLKHPFQHYKLFELRRLLELYQPRSILELGSGTTTSIIVDYVRSAPGRSATIIDDSEKWLENSRHISGAAEGETRIEFLLRPRHENPEPPSTSYDDVPQRLYDFVLVDGPPLRFGGVKNRSAINQNVFDLIDAGLSPKVILIDIRRATVEALRTRSEYDLRTSDVILKNLHDGYCYFSVGLLRAAEPGS